MARLVGWVLVVGLLGIAVPVVAEDCPAGTPVVTFDHAAKADVLSGAVRRADGEQFIIRVVNTKPDEFTYAVTGALAVTQEPSTRFAQTTHDECVTHDKAFGGYIMRVEAKAGTEPELPAKLIIVHVPTEDWQIEFAGAFTAAWFDSPLYGLTPLSNGTFRVVRDEGTADDPKESALRLGVGAFVTTYHDSFPRLGITFGLGINDEKGATYYAGGTWRMGRKAGLTAGLAVGSVDRLPTGTNLGDATTNANLLSDDPQRTTTAFFVAISYSFLGSGDRLKAPFAGQ